MGRKKGSAVHTGLRGAAHWRRRQGGFVRLPGPQLETPEWAGICPPGPKLRRKVRVRAAWVESDGEVTRHESQKHNVMLKKKLLLLQKKKHIWAFWHECLLLQRSEWLNSNKHAASHLSAGGGCRNTQFKAGFMSAVIFQDVNVQRSDLNLQDGMNWSKTTWMSSVSKQQDVSECLTESPFRLFALRADQNVFAVVRLGQKGSSSTVSSSVAPTAPSSVQMRANSHHSHPSSARVSLLSPSLFPG